MSKKIFAIIATLVLVFNLGTVSYAVEKETLPSEEPIIEYAFDINDLKDGVSVVMQKDENGNTYSYVCEDPSQIPMMCSYDDGSTSITAKFWINDYLGGVTFTSSDYCDYYVVDGK